MVFLKAPFVVSYLKTTSNHNKGKVATLALGVVSYLKTTSNHNMGAVKMGIDEVVSYLKTTSNHNHNLIFKRRDKLYLI